MPGIAYGVRHHGKVLQTAGLGFRDIENGKPVTPETIFPIGSMTKALVAQGVAKLVDEGKVQWSDTVSSVLPEFRTRSPLLQEYATVVDYMSMRSGMQSSNVWLQSNNDILFDEQQSLQVLNGLELVRPFRADFKYNNWGYEIAAQVISKISGTSIGEFLKKNIFSPLGLERTAMQPGSTIDPKDYAKAYISLDDTTPLEMHEPYMVDGTLMAGAGATRSCISDLMNLYGALLSAYKDQISSGSTTTPDSPFKQVVTCMSNQNPMPGNTLLEQSYGLGWARAELPGPMGAVGLNPGLVDTMPIVGKGNSSRLAIYHQGSIGGALGFVALFPETDSVVVVLANALALNDAADWIGQFLVELLFDVSEKNDYHQWAVKSAESARAWYGGVKDQLEAGLEKGSKPKSLSRYVGRYWNKSRTLHIDVSL